jgi:c-di-GMP-binding flagellar brake protein YcgR
MSFADKQPHNPSPVPADRREHPRYSAQVQMELREEGSDIPLRLQTTDLSRGGCYIQLIMTLPLGTLVRATLWLDDAPVRIRGRVVTRHPQFGNGIMFLEFEGDGAKLLTRYLDAIEA